MQLIDHFNFLHKKALVRVDFNVPMDAHQRITDDSRMREALPTIHKILREGGAAIVMSHLGRPTNGPEKQFSLAPLVQPLAEMVGAPVYFATDCVGAEALSKAAALQAGEVLLLENLRFHSQETDNDPPFSKALASLGEVYVNDAFGTAHRAHASTHGVVRYFKYKMMGYLMQLEINNANRILHPKHPFIAILGGAKISDKISLIEALLPIVDRLLIGGGMAYTFYKAQGGHIGNSLVENHHLETAKRLLARSNAQGSKIHLPVDSIVSDQFTENASIQTAPSCAILDGWMGLDIGFQAQQEFSQIIYSAKTLLWNGPLGAYELSPFRKGTEAVAQAVAHATQQGAFSLVGGGDSGAAIRQAGLTERISYLSTGGGALLTYLAQGTLPALEVLQA